MKTLLSHKKMILKTLKPLQVRLQKYSKKKSRTKELTVKRVLFHWQLESYSDLQITVTTGIAIMRSLELNANAVR